MTDGPRQRVSEMVRSSVVNVGISVLISSRIEAARHLNRLSCAVNVLAKLMAWMQHTTNAPTRRMQCAHDRQFDLGPFRTIEIAKSISHCQQSNFNLPHHRLGVG